MTVIPCQKNEILRKKIEAFAEVLKIDAHTLGDHGLGEREFYASGLFRGAIERIRGQFAASMKAKREFVAGILNHMKEKSYIDDWESAGEDNRHDYTVVLKSGRMAVIELKGCLDGNNTIIYERPPHANEFVIWSVCTNSSADPRHNVWSGLHTRLSADIISREQQVDGVVVWDSMCNTIGRPCPKMRGPGRETRILGYRLPPPCIYVFPATVPSPRNNPHPPSQSLGDVELLQAFHECFQGQADEVNYVDFRADHDGQDMVRTTTIRRSGRVQRASKPIPIRRR